MSRGVKEYSISSFYVITSVISLLTFHPQIASSQSSDVSGSFSSPSQVGLVQSLQKDIDFVVILTNNGPDNITQSGNDSLFQLTIQLTDADLSNSGTDSLNIIITPSAITGINSGSSLDVSGTLSVSALDKTKCSKVKYLCLTVKPKSNAYNDSTTSNDVTCTAASCLTEPNSVSVTESDEYNINVNWTASAGNPTKYVITYKTGSSSSPITMNVASSASSMYRQVLTPSTTGVVYTVTLLAENSDGQSPSVTNNVAIKPKPPTNVIISGRTDVNLTITITMPSDTELTKYIVTGTGFSDTDCPYTSGATTDCTITGLTAGTHYILDVSSFSASVSSNVFVPKPQQYTKPSKPGSITVSSLTTTSLTLTWDAVTGATGYTVEVTPSEGVTVGAVSGSGTSSAIADLKPGVCYTFKVTSKRESDTSDTSSDINQRTMPNKITEVSIATEVTTTTIKLTWTKPSGTLSGYTIKYNSQKESINSADTTTVTLSTGIEAAKAYSIELITNSGGASNSVTITRNAKPITPSIYNLTTTDSSFCICWVYTYVTSENAMVTWKYLGSSQANSNDTDQSSDLPTSTKCQDTPGLTIAGGQYQVTVFIKSGTAQSDSDTDTLILNPEPVTNLVKNTEPTHDTIEIKWVLPSDGEYTGFKAYHNVSNQQSITNSTLTATFNSLTAGTQYTFHVKSYRTVGGKTKESQDTTADLWTKPSQPGALMKTSSRSRSITIKWLNSAGATGYTVTVTPSGGTKGSVSLSGNDHHMIEVTGLTQAVTYTFTVTATGGDSMESIPRQKTFKTEEEAPGPPLDLVVEEYTDNSVTLRWKAPSDPNGVITNYVIKTTYPNQTQIPDIRDTQLTQIVSNLLSGTTYQFCVSAKNSAGQSNFTLACEMVTTKERPAGQVTGLTVTIESPRTAKLTWGYPDTPNGVIGHYVLVIVRLLDNQCVQGHVFNCSDCNMIPINATGGTQTIESETKDCDKVYMVGQQYTNKQQIKDHMVSALQPYTNFKFKVYAVNSKGLGTVTTQEQLTPQDTSSPPLNLSIVEVTATEVEINWTEPAEPNGPIRFYEIRVFKDNVVMPSLNATLLSERIVNLDSCTPYKFEVHAHNDKNRGQPAIVSTTTLVNVPRSAPSNVMSYNTSSTSMRITWDIPVGETCPIDYSVEVFENMDNTNELQLKLTQIEKVTGYNTTTVVIGELKKYWLYVFKVTANTTEGNSNTSLGSPPQRTYQDTPGLVINETIEVCATCYTKFTVKWSPPILTQLNGIITGYTVKYQRAGVSAKMENTGVTQLIVQNLTPEVEYTVKIVARTIKGSGLEVILKKTLLPGPPITVSLTTLKGLVGDTKAVDKKYSQAKLTLTSAIFVNTNGNVRSYTVIVAQNGQGAKSSGKTVQPGKTWAQAIKSDPIPPYQITAGKGEPWFSVSSRRKRAVTGTAITVIIGGDTSCDIDNTGSYCNGPLEDDVRYCIRIRGFTSNGYADTDCILHTTDKDYRPIIGGVLGTFFGLLLIAAIVGGIFMYRRKMGPFRERDIFSDIRNSIRMSKRSKASIIELDPRKVPRKRPISKGTFADHVKYMHKDSDYRFSEEYELIKNIAKVDSPSWDAAEEQCNRAKNRYTNILPFDHSRVKLYASEEGEDDYINANYMLGYNTRREFIAAQGPLPATVEDFWRMIWEQNIHMIVMVTKCTENGRHKCAQYWPNGDEPEYFGEVVVTVKSESVLSEYNIRLLEAKMGNDSSESPVRIIKQFHFTAWPDHGCPSSVHTLINFVRAVRSHIRPDIPGPILVHCSAGVGRTGTFIVMDRLLQYVPDHDSLDVFGTVNEMREYRCNMVQTEDQYIFIHDCMKYVIEIESRQDEEDDDEEKEPAENLYDNAEMITLHEAGTKKSLLD